MRIWKSGGTTGGSSHVDAVHRADTNDPHDVTAAQVDLGNVDDTSDADKPLSDDAVTALALKADDADLTSHENDTANPHVTTATHVGLGNVDNTTDAGKPVSTAQATAIGLKQDADPNLTTLAAAPSTLGWYARSKADGTVEWIAHSSGIDTLDDLSDVTSAAITNRFVLVADGSKYVGRALLEADISDLQTYALGSALTTHLADVANPHVVTQTQVGLGNVANRSEADMVAGAGAIFDEFASKSDTGHNHALGDLTGDTDDITDTTTNRFATDAQLTAIATNTTAVGLRALATDLTDHEAEVGNPHSVTKAQVGLTDADDTADTAKPISTLQQAEIDTKQDTTTELDSLTDVSGSTENYVPTVNAGLTGYDLVAIDSIGGLALDELDDVTSAAYTAKNALMADGAAYVGRPIVEGDITSPDYSVFADPAHDHDTDYGALANVTTNDAHVADVTTNPHAVTKAQVGLTNTPDRSEAQMVAGAGAIFDEFATKRPIISTQTFASTDTVIDSSDDIFVTYTGATGTLTLPSAVTGHRVTVMCGAGDTCTVAANTGDSIQTGSYTAINTANGGVLEFVALDTAVWANPFAGYMKHTRDRVTVNEDDIALLEDKPLMIVRKTGQQQISSQTFELVTWDASAIVDTDSGWEADHDDTYTVQTDGWYRYHFHPSFEMENSDNSDSDKNRIVSDLQLDSVSIVRRGAVPTQVTGLSNSWYVVEPEMNGLWWFDATDDIRIRIWQGHTAGRFLMPTAAADSYHMEFSLEWVRGA